jgi:hypothetical protein
MLGERRDFCRDSGFRVSGAARVKRSTRCSSPKSGYRPQPRRAGSMTSSVRSSVVTSKLAIEGHLKTAVYQQQWQRWQDE